MDALRRPTVSAVQVPGTHLVPVLSEISCFSFSSHFIRMSDSVSSQYVLMLARIRYHILSPVDLNLFRWSILIISHNSLIS